MIRFHVSNSIYEETLLTTQQEESVCYIIHIVTKEAEIIYGSASALSFLCCLLNRIRSVMGTEKVFSGPDGVSVCVCVPCGS